MTLYYFHIRSGEIVLEDDEGSEYENDALALLDADAAAREMIANRIQGGEIIGPQVIHIVDDTGRFVAEVPLKEVALGLIETNAAYAPSERRLLS